MWRTRHTQIRIAAYFNRSFPSKGSLSVFIQLILLDVWVFFYSFFFYSFFKYKIHMFNFLLGIIWNFSRNESIDGQFFSHVERLIFYQAFIKQIFFIFEYYTKLTNRAFGLFKELFVAFIFCLFFFFWNFISSVWRIGAFVWNPYDTLKTFEYSQWVKVKRIFFSKPWTNILRKWWNTFYK